MILRAFRGSDPAAVSRLPERLPVAGPAGMMCRELALLAELEQAASSGAQDNSRMPKGGVDLY